MGALTLRLRDVRGGAVEILEWGVGLTTWRVPPSRIPCYPAFAGKPVTVELRGRSVASGIRVPWSRVTVVAPVELPAEVDGTVPDWDRDIPDPLRVLPVAADDGQVLHGMRWDPPPDRPGVEPIHADASGVLVLPKALLESLARPGEPPLGALFDGLVVPPEVSIEAGYPPSVALDALGAVLRGAELRVVVYASTAEGPVASLRVVGPDGHPFAGARALIGHRRERSDALGVIRIPRCLGDAEATFYSPAGILWEHVYLHPTEGHATVGTTDAPTEIRLPPLRRVEIGFAPRPSESALRITIELGRLLGDGTWIGSGWSQEGRWEPENKVAEVTLPEGRGLRLRATTGDVSEDGTPDGGALFTLAPSDERIVLDWPVTRVISRGPR